MILTEQRNQVYTPLEKCRGPRHILDGLAALGVTTLEELQDLWAHGDQTALAHFLGSSPNGALWMPGTVAPGLRVTRGASKGIQLVSRRPLIHRQRGLILSEAERTRRAGRPGPVKRSRRGPGKTVDLINRFPAVRAQSDRGTCVAFASVALLEFCLYSGRSRIRDHSEQFAYWACKEKDGFPNESGTHVRMGRVVLKKDGACLETTWPYERENTGPTEGQGPASMAAINEAKKFRLPSVRRTSSKNVERLKEHLDQEQPVVIGVKTYPMWDSAPVQESGDILMPVPGEIADGGHAVVLVGYEIRAGVPGGGVFIFRNSWGPQWAKKSGRFGGGYGTLSFEYVRRYGIEAFYAKSRRGLVPCPRSSAPFSGNSSLGQGGQFMLAHRSC